MVIRCSAADLVDRYCEILKEFEERANNRVCERHYKELVKATEALLRSNGMLVEVHKALELEWEEEDTGECHSIIIAAARSESIAELLDSASSMSC